MKKIKLAIIPLLLAIAALAGFTQSAVLSVREPVKIAAASDGGTHELGLNDCVTVPLANFIVKNFEHDPTGVDSYGFQDLLKFVLTNGSETAVVWFYMVRAGKHSTGFYPAYTYNCDLANCVSSRYACSQCASLGSPCYECARERILCGCDILLFIETSNGLVITQNTESFYANIFDTVTIYTYESSVTILAGSFVQPEFTVTFKDMDGNVLAEIETVGRYIPSDLIPTAPQINNKPFLYWTNAQGHKTNEIITSDVVFAPRYGYDPNFKIDVTENDTKPADKDSFFQEYGFYILLISACSVAVIFGAKLLMKFL